MSDRLSDDTLAHLARVADLPDLTGTRYDLVDAIGRGGMGTVYRARDRELDREVAIKVLAAVGPAAEAAGRMRREARVLARLEHPGIVPVHDVGVLPDGRVFYVMKLVRGARLDEPAAGAPLDDRLRIFERLCETVAFAHAHGVVHRDLKPENVMVGEFGEVLVLDWGVAQVAGADAEAPGTRLGTPGFMAPEQARGEATVDERADVYALGGVLAFLMGTEEAPARAASSRSSRARRSLHSVLEKARAAAPADRYASARDLGDDVARYRAGLAPAAHAEGPWEKTRRLAARYRTPLLLVAAYLVARAILLAIAGL